MTENLTPKELYELNHGKKQEEKRMAASSNKYNGAKLHWLLYGLILVAVAFIGKTLFFNGTRTEASEEISNVRAQDQVKGNPQASVTLIEYSDFQCPACKYYSPIVNELANSYGNKVKVIYRHFPLKSHRNAQLAAQAAEAAGKQQKFWEMHNKLFELQADWGNSSKPKDMFKTYAQELGLNVEQFLGDISSSEVKQKVKSDMNEGYGLGLQGTPSFFLNGEKINNPRSVDDLKRMVDETLPPSP